MDKAQRNAEPVRKNIKTGRIDFEGAQRSSQEYENKEDGSSGGRKSLRREGDLTILWPLVRHGLQSEFELEFILDDFVLEAEKERRGRISSVTRIGPRMLLGDVGASNHIFYYLTRVNSSGG